MSRQTKLKQHVKEGTATYEDSESEEEEKDFNQDQWDMIDQLSDMFEINEHQAIKAFKEADYNFDNAVQYIQKSREREKEKEEKIKEKEAKKKQKEKQKVAIQQQKEKEALEMEIKKKKSEDQIHRKSSTDEQPILNARKNSYIVEEYQTDHYNMEYPSINQQNHTQLSKTINIVVVGHVDSGKSTLVGIFLREAAFLDKKEAHRNEKQSKQIGMESFKHAWVTDSTEEERTRGVTIDVGVKKIELGDRKIVFLDSPGHRDFIPNMITGAAQADYAILVIDVDNFESAFVGGGQTKEHAYIVKSLGVHKLIIAMNKMDRINWSAERFVVIKNKLDFYLRKIGFAEESIIYVPISAINAINITEKNIKKFQAQNVVYDKAFSQVIESLELPLRPIDKPFRMNITNFYQSQSGKIKGHCLSGKIEGGVVKKDEKLIILPQNAQCLVKQILVSNEKVKQAVVGDNVELQIKLIDETYFQTITHGNVLSSLKYSIPVTQKIVVQALALDLQVPILRGTEVIVYIGTNKTPARITKINFIYNPSDGTILKKNPKSIRSNDCAQIEIETKQKVCAQLFANFKTFGRVIIREKKVTLFVGTIKMIK